MLIVPAQGRKPLVCGRRPTFKLRARDAMTSLRNAGASKQPQLPTRAYRTDGNARICRLLLIVAFYLLSLLVAFFAGLLVAERQRPTGSTERFLQEADTGCWLTKQAGEELGSAFLRLHAELFAKKVLPVSAFGLGRPMLQPHMMKTLLGPNTTYRAKFDQVASITNRAVSRVAFVRFLGRAMARFAPKAVAAAKTASRPMRCLEWDGRWYLAQYEACEETWTFSLMSRIPSVNIGQKSFRGDLLSIQEQHPSLLRTFHIIFCSQVFEHVAQPHVAATSLAALLAPGGYLIWTAPFMEPTHGVPFDYFRFTIGGASKLFIDAGLSIVATEKSGNSEVTSAYLLGFACSELNQSMLLNELTKPVSEKSLAKIMHGPVHGTCKSHGTCTSDQNLYISSMLVARAPSVAAGTRRVWTLLDAKVSLPPAAASGLSWRNVGDTMPGEGELLLHGKLEAALQHNTTLSQRHWEAMRITDLRTSHVVKAGTSFFRPVS